MTNHKQGKAMIQNGRSHYFKPTEITPELEKELKDPKGWITGRLLPKRKMQKNKIMKKKETPKKRPKGRSKRRGYELPEATVEKLESSPLVD